MKLSKSLCAIAMIALLCTGCTYTDSDPTVNTTSAAVTTPSATAPGVTEPTVTEPVETKPTEPPATEPPEPVKPSLLGFLKTAVSPVGSTMYIWGGGWNEADTGAGIEAVTLGLSPQWSAFAALQDSSYNYKNHRYEIHNGLDCSGFAGWTVYNALETENGRPGYVVKASTMAQSLADRGLGQFIPAKKVDAWLPGDIMSMKGHVWISLGMCSDGSVLMVHASPPGVILCGTALPDGSKSQAVALAEQVMAEQFPDWYSRYPRCDRGYHYLESSSAMRWGDILSDTEGVRQMTADEVVEALFPGGAES